jgi:hypothetical protein
MRALALKRIASNGVRTIAWTSKRTRRGQTSGSALRCPISISRPTAQTVHDLCRAVYGHGCRKISTRESSCALDTKRLTLGGGADWRAFVDFYGETGARSESKSPADETGGFSLLIASPAQES